MEYLDSRHSEWIGMWKELACSAVNQGDHICLHKHHRWEYMGSNRDHHNFRHQHHPLTGRIEHIYIERRTPMTSWTNWPQVSFLAQHAEVNLAY